MSISICQELRVALDEGMEEDVAERFAKHAVSCEPCTVYLKKLVPDPPGASNDSSEEAVSDLILAMIRRGVREGRIKLPPRSSI